jgi:titin
VALALVIAVPAAVLGVTLTAQVAGASPTITNYPNPNVISIACGITTGADGALWFTNSRTNSIGRMTTDGHLTTYSGVGVSRPCAITMGPDGALWFVNAGSIGRIATDGTITAFTGTGVPGLAEGPGVLTVGPDNALWFVNTQAGTVGRITTGGTVTSYPGAFGNPKAITAGPDGALWFTNSTPGSISRITTAGNLTTFTNPGVLTPIGIVAGPDGALWFTNSSNTITGSIGRVTTAGAFTFYADDSIDGATGITVGSDGALWFTNVSRNTIGRITTAGAVTSYGDIAISGASGITSGPDGALWFTDSTSVWQLTTSGTFVQHRASGTSNPFGMVAGPDGAMWFTNRGNNSIGRITTDGVVTTFTDPGIATPLAITAGPDGALWFTNNPNSVTGEPYSIGRITTSGVVTTYTDPNIANPQAITTGPDGALWFTNSDSNSIGRITTAGTVTTYTDASIASPVGITSGPDGALWFTNNGNNSIGRITSAGIVSNFTNLNISSPDGITAGPDGALWFTNFGHNANWVGRITTTGTVTRVNAVIGFAITTGPDGAIWMTDPSDSLVARVTTTGGFSNFFNPGINQPYGIAAGPDGSMWVANYGNNSISRIGMPNPPAPPTIGVTTAQNLAAQVSFSAPTDNGGSPIIGYTATCTPSGGGGAVSASGTASPIRVSGLTNGSTYTCAVTASNDRGTGAPSAASNAVVPMQTVPDAPTIGTAVANNDSVAVPFTPPTDDGGSAVLDYTATCRGTGFGSLAPSATKGTSPITVTGFTGGDLYTCSVTARNTIGSGAPSAVSNSVFPKSVPPAPTIGAFSVTGTTGSVAFFAPVRDGGSPITAYTATCTSSDLGITRTGNLGKTSTGEWVDGPISVPSLTAGKKYTCTVTATNALGTSLPSAKSAAQTVPVVPGAPTNAAAVPGSGQASVSWAAPTSNGGSPITGYVVTPYIGTVAQTARTKSVGASPLSTVLTGLTNGTAYTFRVAAKNLVGLGSVAVSSPIVVGAPVAPVVTAIGSSTSAAVSWTLPANNGSAITKYIVTTYLGTVLQTTRTHTLTCTQPCAPARTWTVIGLTSGSLYTFKVIAVNARGNGPPGSTTIRVGAPTLPGAPTGLHATAGVGNATVSWAAGGNGSATITASVITPYKAGVAQAAITVAGTATTRLVTGLTAGLSYTFKVASRSVVGTGAQSAASNAVTPT